VSDAVNVNVKMAQYKNVKMISASSLEFSHPAFSNFQIFKFSN